MGQIKRAYSCYEEHIMQCVFQKAQFFSESRRSCCVSSIYDNSNAIGEIFAHSPTSCHRFKALCCVEALSVTSMCERDVTLHLCPRHYEGSFRRKRVFVCLSVYLSCALSLNFLISPASPVYIAASVHTTSLSLRRHPFALLPSFSVFPRFPRL